MSPAGGCPASKLISRYSFGFPGIPMAPGGGRPASNLISGYSYRAPQVQYSYVHIMFGVDTIQIAALGLYCAKDNLGPKIHICWASL